MTTRQAGLKLINVGLSPLGVRLLGPGETQKYLHGDPTPHQLRTGLFHRMGKKGLDVRHVVDVGAHRAGWSRDAREVWPSAAFTLIEPLEELGPDLKRFIAESPDGKATWIHAGAGAMDGELTFTALPDKPDAGTFRMSETESQAAGGSRRSVPVRTLDSICAGAPAPEIVKIDAEGLDIDVLRGASTLIGKTEVFFVELPMFEFFDNQSLHSILEFMRNAGYEPFDITDMNRRPSDGALGLIEVAFAKRNGVLRDHNGW